jgi:1,4-dihydroxy-2-naphthoyl-CoA synthase
VERPSIPPVSEAAVKPSDARRTVDISLSPNTKIAVERRGQIVLIGINRPQRFNRIDPETFYGLAKAYYEFDNDPTLRAAVLVGHGEHFSRGNDVEAFSALAKSGKAFTLGAGQLDPLGRAQKLSKPLVAVAHGDTWNMGHELHLNGDIRIARTAVFPVSHRYAGQGRLVGPTPCDTCSRAILGARTRRSGWGSFRRLHPTKRRPSRLRSA